MLQPVGKWWIILRRKSKLDWIIMSKFGERNAFYTIHKKFVFCRIVFLQRPCILYRIELERYSLLTRCVKLCLDSHHYRYHIIYMYKRGVDMQSRLSLGMHVSHCGLATSYVAKYLAIIVWVNGLLLKKRSPPSCQLFPRNKHVREMRTSHVFHCICVIDNHCNCEKYNDYQWQKCNEKCCLQNHGNFVHESLW